MLYLVIDAVKLGFVAPDLAVAQMKMLQQTFNIYRELKEQGKLKFAYAFADSPGGIMVLDVASNEELQQTLFLLPSMPLVNRTVRPLTEIKSVEDLIAELESIVSSMPRKPGQEKPAG
jgi:muconolactone D-isomerase